MSRLIKANFARLFKSVFFKVCIIFSAGLGILLDFSRYADIQKNPEIYEGLGAQYKAADGFVFSGALYIVFAAAAFVGIFLGTEYSDGTIRNKLMVGHKRWEIYLSNFIVCLTANITFLLVFIITTLGVGELLLSASYLSFTQIVVFTLSQCAAMAAFTAILVLFSMIIQSKATGSVTALILTVVMVFATLYISAKLEEEEYYTTRVSYTGEIYDEPQTRKNPAYIAGTKREIYEFLNNALPVNQFYQVTKNTEENIGIMAVYSAILIVLSSGVGIVIFRKKDLK
ncbi:MAG: ABC transporter permease subunit [Ruminococcus sp.]|nr:ABC transporter permease subunit [Ruminococcus sp.]